MSKCTENTKAMTKLMHVNLQSEDPQVIQEHYQNLREEMTRILPEGHPVQLTLLWEHVVKTHEFPSNVDPRLVFREIFERLKNPEWQVRQHALRVLTDILPTLNVNVIAENMESVVAELVSNLGHSTPAVRKGSLDALRIYLLHTNDNEFIIKNIIFTELNRSEELNNFRSNVKIGIILSIPLLLFPSKKSEGPSRETLKQISLALIDRLLDGIYQKAAVRSLIKIRNIIGEEEFNSFFTSINEDIKNKFNTLCSTYNLTTKEPLASKDEHKENNSLSDTSVAITSEKQCENENEVTQTKNNTTTEENTMLTLIPPSRVVLETEIKFNEETAITMTILEEKRANNKSKKGVTNDVKVGESMNEIQTSLQEKRKISRRVHFGGEEIKLRTPESEDSEPIIKESQRSKIPLPLSPATKIPRYRRSLLNLSNDEMETFLWKRSASMTNVNKKCEHHIHNANLSPKKSILTNNANNSNNNVSSVVIKSPIKVHQNVLHSPKKEQHKKEPESKAESFEKIADYEKNMTIDDVPAGSFKIFLDEGSDDNHSSHQKSEKSAFIDKKDSENKVSARKSNEVSSASSNNSDFSDSSLEKENKTQIKSRVRSLDRKIDKKSSKLVNYGRRELNSRQNSGNKEKMKRHRSMDIFPNNISNDNFTNNTDSSPENGDLNSYKIYADDYNFEVLKDYDDVFNHQNLTRRNSRRHSATERNSQHEYSDFTLYPSDYEFTFNNYKNRNNRKIAKSNSTSTRNHSDFQYDFM